MYDLALYVVSAQSSERKRRIIVHGSVARYGPWNQLPAQGGGVEVESRSIAKISQQFLSTLTLPD